MKLKVTNLLSGGSGGEEPWVWEEHEVRVHRGVSGGFGFAVSGAGEGGEEVEGGEVQVVVEDVVEGGPAMGRLRVGDRVVRVEGREVVGWGYGEVIQVRAHLIHVTCFSVTYH